MKNAFIKIGLGIGIIATMTAHGYSQEIIEPTIKTPTTFAMVIDSRTFGEAKAEVMAYRDVIEKDGLGTYIIAHNWERPDQIREQLLKIHQSNRPLEGTVLIGDIPIVMIRDAQHLTSAFKMNQRLRWERSSVPSDRYYDDFDLQFDFLMQDTTAGREHYFYYSLHPQSPQYIEMDIYSGRIKPPVEEGENAIDKIKDYLKKVVVERGKQHLLTDMVVSVGHGYNSNSINSVMGEALALRSQFPSLFQPGGSIKFLNFRNADFMKFNLLRELKREGVDFAYMTGHGTPTLQLINGYPLASNPQPSMANVARYLRSKVRAAQESDRDLEEVKANFKASLGVSDKWMDDAFDPKRIEEDSIFNDNLDVQIRDVKDAGIQATFVYSNSCLTGSFHLDQYIAGYYPFSNNKTIAAVASSVGILQDLWPAELMGILQQGVRVGNWLKQIAYLETHVLGDPTFHFESERALELNRAIGLPADASYWENLLSVQNPDLQGLALKYLARTWKEDQVSPLLKDYYFNSPYETTRMQAFSLLKEFENADYFEVLHAAKNDPYEFIRRRAVYDLADFGGNEFVPDLIEFYINDPHSERVNYRIRSSMEFFDPALFKEEVEKQIRNNPRIYNAEELSNELKGRADYTVTKVDKMKEMIFDQSLTERARENEIRTLRLYRYHYAVPAILELILNEEELPSLRVAALEAMGWFVYSYQRDAILDACDTLLARREVDESVRKEALRTKNRVLSRRLTSVGE